MKTYEEQTEQVFAEDLRNGIWLSNSPESAIMTHMLMWFAGQTSAPK